MKVKGIKSKEEINGKIIINLIIDFNENDYKNTKTRIENPGIKVILEENKIHDILVTENEEVNNNFRLWPYEREQVIKYLIKEGIVDE